VNRQTVETVATGVSGGESVYVAEPIHKYIYI
jgi:hypothetical protein